MLDASNDIAYTHRAVESDPGRRTAPGPNRVGGSGHGDTRLCGAITQICGSELEIQGLCVDPSAAQCRNHRNQPISRERFYALISLGSTIAVEQAIYDPLTSTVIPGLVRLVSDPAASG